MAVAASVLNDEILTGEGVALRVQAASPMARAASWLIDVVATAIALVVLGVAATQVFDDVLDEASAVALVSVVLVAGFVGLPTAVETLSHGRSLGKLALGIRVIRDDGGPVRLHHALTRALVAVFELWVTMGGVAFLASMLNDRGKRVGDLMAGTYAANVRGAKSTTPPLGMPPELIGWTQNTDLRPLPEGLALRARQFLSRAAAFPPPSRERLGLRLAAQVEQYVAPSPPHGTHPERFLAAVLFERRLREQRAVQARTPRLNAQLAGLERLPYGIPDPET
ncbi:MAG: RDD family protein [Propionibacteriaceae bacterium]|jgi:uncharacterized RDD family membrane protein YckC|nr:RDD family protein [Propionibacteriaceae bacterium]